MKNAYEIRLEILHMAHQDLQTAALEKARNLILKKENKGEEIDTQELEALMIANPQEIIKRAEELYKFVDNKDGDR